MKVYIKKFKTFEEQEKADIKHYMKLSPDKKILELEFIRNFHIKQLYGRIPRLRRIYKITKRKQG
jgi:hypothetical protein